MGVHMATLWNADPGSPKGGVAPVHLRCLRCGTAGKPAAPEPQGSQQHKEALARTSKSLLGAHGLHCLMCARRSARNFLPPPSTLKTAPAPVSTARRQYRP